MKAKELSQSTLRRLLPNTKFIRQLVKCIHTATASISPLLCLSYLHQLQFLGLDIINDGRHIRKVIAHIAAGVDECHSSIIRYIKIKLSEMLKSATVHNENTYILLYVRYVCMYSMYVCMYICAVYNRIDVHNKYIKLQTLIS